MWRELFTRARALSQGASKQLAPHLYTAKLLPRRLRPCPLRMLKSELGRPTQ